MPSSELEDQTRPTPEEPASPKMDEPAWPPVEARPEEPPSAEADPPAASILTKAEEPPAPKLEEPVAEATVAAEAAKPKLDESAAEPKLDESAAEPKQEMGFSESTLHWLVDDEKPVEPLPDDPGTAPHYDPGAPVPGRKRTVTVIGGATIVALVVAAILHAQAARNSPDVETPGNEPAAVLTERAEAALTAGHAAEAMELAHLAIVADPRFADAYVVVGKVERDSRHPTESRDAYRKYLELAPIGTHAGEARAALAALPP